jgi:putative toxin-antitoxin system antitoxin component (TIGR02293 family)
MRHVAIILSDMATKMEETTMQGTSIGVRPRDLNDLIGKLKQGLPVGAFDRLRKRLDVPEKMLASTVNIAYRTLSRRKKEGRFKTDESERVLRIARLYEKALDVLEDDEITRQWFKMPAKALGGITPLEYADTEPGAQEVEELLVRIEYGVFS